MLAERKEKQMQDQLALEEAQRKANEEKAA